MARTYSERFMIFASAGANEARQFTVPTGRRAVVRQVTVNNAGAGATTVFIAIAGIYIYRLDLPAPPSFRTEAVRWTVYEGELVIALCATASVRVSVDGHLFEDTSADRAPAGIEEAAASLEAAAGAAGPGS